jgi:hypothetical protein
MAVFNLLKIFTSLLFGGEPVTFPATPVAPLPVFSRKEAMVVKAIEPLRTGQIRFQGSWWSARCQRDITLQPGELVNVVGRQNITLLVEPVAPSRSNVPNAPTGVPLPLKSQKEVQLV